MRQIESSELTVVGVNAFEDTAESPLGGDGSFLKVDPAVETEMVADIDHWRSSRSQLEVNQALENLRQAADGEDDSEEAKAAAAKAKTAKAKAAAGCTQCPPKEP